MSQPNQKIVDFDGVKYYLDGEKAIAANLLVPVQKYVTGSVYLFGGELVTINNYKDKVFVMCLVNGHDEMALINLRGNRFTNPIKIPSHRPTDEQWGILTNTNDNFTPIIDLGAFLMELFEAAKKV